MITAVRLFVCIILLLAGGTVVLPLAMRQSSTSHGPTLTVLVDGKTADENITIKVDDTVYPCKQGSCALPSYQQTKGEKFTIAQLTAQRDLVWVIDATDVLKKFDRLDMTMAVDSAQSIVTQVDSIAPDTGATTDQPLTLENLGVQLNLQPDTIKLLGVVLVIVVIFVGMKFMSTGGAHH